MRKIILTGSAPYLPDWWNENKDRLSEFEVHSINTSILITKDICKKWYCSADYFYFHPELNENIVAKDVYVNTWYKYPWTIKYNRENTSGTMFFNVLEYLYNENVELKDLIEINVIGCDLVYKEGKNNHFYKGGTPDPMRLGLSLLKENVEFFKQEYKKMSISLYNLSTQSESLLTFERRML